MSVSNITSDKYFNFAQGGGETGELIRTFNWSDTSLGDIRAWPQSLRTSLGIILRSAFPMFIFWGNDLICFYNDAFRPSLGDNGKHPAIGKRAKDVWPEVWDVIRPMIEQVMTTGEPVWFEDYYLPIYRNGAISDAYWTFSFSSIYGDSGNIDGVLVTCNETTEKVKIHNRLIESEKRFQNLIREATIGIVVLVGDNLVVQEVNRSYCTLINRNANEVIGKALFDIIPETAADFREPLNNVRKSGIPVSLYDCPFYVLVDGKKKEGFLNLVLQPYKEEDGRISGVVAMCQEVTEQVIAKKQLEENEKQFHLMADSIVQMIWVTDPEGMHEYYNKRWYDFTGATVEESAGEGWNAMFHPDDRERAWEKWRYSLQTGKPYEIEYRLRDKHGEYVWVLGRAAPIFNSEGKITKWFGTCTDINEQKRLQNQKEEFISVASHELKTPLTSLKALLQLIQREIGKEDNVNPLLKRMVNSSNAHANKLSQLVSDLLDVTRIEQGQLTLRKSRFLLDDLINTCCETIRLGNHNTNVYISGDRDVQVSADYQKIEQVVTNLLTNCIKYAPNSDKIMLHTETNPGFIKVSIQDFGPGIDTDKLQHLFDIYYRADTSGHQYSGLGLGLYICSRIIENHDGQIGVESETGIGSTFWFTIPL